MEDPPKVLATGYEPSLLCVNEKSLRDVFRDDAELPDTERKTPYHRNVKATEPLLLLPLPIERARALLRSEGGRRTLVRTIRHARARGVVLQGWHRKVREILGQIRTLHPKLAIALALPQADWGRFGAAAGGKPLLCVVEPPTDKVGVGQLRALVYRAAVEREPTLRYTMHPALPCLLGDWQPDLVIAHAESTPVERDHSRCTDCAAIGRCPGPRPAKREAMKPAPRALRSLWRRPCITCMDNH